MNDKVNIENIDLAERIRLGVQKALRKLQKKVLQRVRVWW